MALNEIAMETREMGLKDNKPISKAEFWQAQIEQLKREGL